jgi:nicotinamide phosphoribosyltransferase
MFAVVSDTYDIYHAVKNVWGIELSNRVRNNGGTLVIRPDSGKVHVPAEVLNLLGDAFGYTVNKKGYRVLPDYIRVIHGDSVNEKTIPQIYDIMMDGAHGWSADNIAFGMGGELLQTVNRDTLGFAQKASAVKFKCESHWGGIKKTPVGDPGKNSKAGRLALVKAFANTATERFITIQEHSLNGDVNYLEKVWENGVLYRDQTLDEIRELSNRP